MPVTEGSDLYFFALMTDTVTQTAVHALKNEMLEKFGCKAALRSEAHITLIPPFRWSRIGTPILMQTVRQIEIHSSEFEIQLEGFGHFQSRVLFVQPIQNIHLYEIRKQLINSLSGLFGEKINANYQFHPHVTIANRDLPATEFPQIWSTFKDRLFKSSWTCRDIALLKHNGSRWEVVHNVSFLNQ